jgi:hypothetical protein
MRRVHFIEIHDQPWFPASLRDQVTDALQFGLSLSKFYAPIVPLLQSELDSSGCRTIVDLCSGGGGPWLALSRKVKGRSHPIRILLTDKYPNLGAYQNVSADSGNQIIFFPGPVDARKVPRELEGLRTMFTSFHHFPPSEARAILQNAVDAGQCIGVYEITRRAPSTITLMFPWVLMLFLLTPWIRPFRWSRLLWTYLIPVIPLVLMFDGVMSCLRTYRPDELKEIVGKLTAKDYEWEVGEHAGAIALMPITYLIGRPRTRP